MELLEALQTLSLATALPKLSSDCTQNKNKDGAPYAKSDREWEILLQHGEQPAAPARPALRVEAS
jgi:hypothetical protein